MNLRGLTLAALIVADAGTTAAYATTYDFSYTGAGVDDFMFTVSTPITGGTGYMGGPAQIYPSAASGANFPAANGVDWVDFYAYGTTLQFGEGNATGFSLVASSPFFALTALTGAESGRYEVTFPGLSTGATPIALSSNPGGGVLTVTAVPEPATWALMLLGFAAIGLAGYRRTTRVSTSLIDA